MGDVEELRMVVQEWGIDLGGEGGDMAAQMMGSAVLLRGWSGRNGSRRGKENGQPTPIQEEPTELTKEEKEKQELEKLRQMKETLKRLLQNYEMIPNVSFFFYKKTTH